MPKFDPITVNNYITVNTGGSGGSGGSGSTAPSVPNSRSPYGFTWYHYGNATQVLLQSQFFTDAVANGIGRLRFQIPWDVIEASQGNYTWGTLDDVVGRCNVNGLAITVSLQNQPSFYSWQTLDGSGNNNYVPNVTNIATFATQIATRYNGSNGHGFIDRFDLNEEWDSYGSGTSTTAYADRSPKYAYNAIKNVAQAIKAASPYAEFWGPGIWWDQTPHLPEFVAGLYEYGVMQYLDGLSLHWYPYESGSNANQIDAAQWVYTWAGGSNGGQEIVPNLAQALMAMRDTMLQHGDLKKIRLAEISWLSNGNGDSAAVTNHNVLSESLQWRNLWYALEVMRQLGCVEGMDWWTMDYGGLVGSNFSIGDSLVQWNGSSWSYVTAWTGLTNYIKTYPRWDNQAGKATQEGFNQSILATDLGFFLDSTLSPANPTPRNASSSSFNGSTSNVGSDQQTWARMTGNGTGTQGFTSASYMKITSSVTNRDLFAYGTKTALNVEAQVCGQLNNSGDKLGVFVCGNGSSLGTTSMYYLEMSNGTLTIYKVTSGTFTSYQSLSMTTTLGTDYRLRIRAFRNVVYGWAWADTAQEPVDFSKMLRIVDLVSPLSAGSFGIGAYSTTGTGVLFHSFMAVETDAAGVSKYIPVLSTMA